jgi:hypothetical protein
LRTDIRRGPIDTFAPESMSAHPSLAAQLELKMFRVNVAGISASA